MQSASELLPAVVKYVPAEQSMQSDAASLPALFKYLPAMH
eukprot:SAG31_NODE_34956_length_327_cov_1.280702_2_plen_39_part_01